MDQQPPPPISLPSLLKDLIGVINEIQRKNVTMINYYIYPSPVPTEISAYEPRLLILRTRIVDFSRLSLPHITTLIDDAPALVASYLRPNITQLINSSHGIQKLFIEHYDRNLEKSLPYQTIQQTLQYFDRALHDFLAVQMTNPRRQPAENHVPPYSSTSPSLCRGAIAFLNNRDHGKVSQVSPDDLFTQHRGRLADRGGVVLWWECPVCAFRHRYHVSNSAALNINQTDEIMVEDDVESLAYRSAWLVKCHIYHPRQPKPSSPSPRRSPSPKSPKTAKAEPTSPKQSTSNAPASHFIRRPSAAKRVSFTRRKSSSGPGSTVTWNTITGARVINRSPSPRRPTTTTTTSSSSQSRSSQAQTDPSKSSKKAKAKPTPDPTGPNGLKYYCPFCIAQGKPMLGAAPRRHDSDSDNDHAQRRPHDDETAQTETTCFEDSQEFMEHIEDHHMQDRPVGLLLQRLRVAVLGETAPGSPQDGRVGRWDLDLR